MTEVDGTRWDNLALCIVQLVAVLFRVQTTKLNNISIDSWSYAQSNQTPIKPIFDTILATVTTQSKSDVPPHELSRMSLISFPNPTGPLFKGIERSYLNDSD
ncbi:Uncharacterized protein BM_BM17532 [Brugia malayi]|uniref:Uncharacterized protein n=1 Tax=Brugia malayi TaxID=6279 RepID=A0A4E9FE91_BRUMA|nr:Uncharacterized protein BM_BM17532 [Brugia malayi]VIO94554.1 Uncharacterized protein BM_BM17532 [Brugia malayi]